MKPLKVGDSVTLRNGDKGEVISVNGLDETFNLCVIRGCEGDYTTAHDGKGRIYSGGSKSGFDIIKPKKWKKERLGTYYNAIRNWQSVLSMWCSECQRNRTPWEYRNEHEKQIRVKCKCGTKIMHTEVIA